MPGAAPFPDVGGHIGQRHLRNEPKRLAACVRPGDVCGQARITAKPASRGGAISDRDLKREAGPILALERSSHFFDQVDAAFAFFEIGEHAGASV